MPDRHWPYGFCTVLPLVVYCCSIYLALKANRAGSAAWTWVLGGMALAFNPILPLRLDRSDWRVVDLIAAAIFLVFVAKYKPTGLSHVSARTKIDEYTSYESLAPDTTSFTIRYQVTVTTPGAKYNQLG